ncbi:MAG TPA: fatty acid desaturase [Alphaproteobacteria bacterium]|nr:fatty acid desaturase [Alphaproteobacteria bacterium]
MPQVTDFCHPDAHPQSGLRSLVARYETPSLAESAFQIITSIGLFAASCAAMYWSLHVSYLLTLLLAVPTAGFVVRTFIIQHDCGHGAFFKSRRANDLLGRACSVITLTPYANWRRQHNCHHSNWNNLDRRESGADIYSACLTVEEYRALSSWGRFVHRFVRHPIVAQFVVPPLVFLFLYRIPFDTPRAWSRERRSVYWTNLAILTLFGALTLLVGLKDVLMVQLPIITLASIMGIGLFAIQHRYEGVVWTRQNAWNAQSAALQGSSYFALPRILQWFTGNIGFHHVHHLSPRVPNYRLQACHDSIPALQAATTLTLRQGLRSLRLILWDEANRRMVRLADVGDAISRNMASAKEHAVGSSV